MKSSNGRNVNNRPVGSDNGRVLGAKVGSGLADDAEGSRVVDLEDEFKSLVRHGVEHLFKWEAR